MIDMLLKGGAVTGSPLLPNMEFIMQICLLAALVSVPLMLFIRPTYEIIMKSKREKRRAIHKIEMEDFEQRQKAYSLNPD